MNKPIEVTHRVGYYNKYALIVPDHAAGRRNRYTVYLIPASPSRKIQIIGRELPLGHAKKHAAKMLREAEEKAKKTEAKIKRQLKAEKNAAFLAGYLND